MIQGAVKISNTNPKVRAKIKVYANVVKIKQMLNLNV